MKDEEYQAIRERVNNTAPGPWFVGNANVGDSQYGALWVVSQEQTDISDEAPEEWAAEISVGHLEDAEFIAHAREDIPKLLNEVERLRAALLRVVTAGEIHNGRNDVIGWSPEAIIAREALA